MDLIAWLEDLAAAYRIEPSERTTRRYLRSLEQWRLTVDQWESRADQAVLRFPRFPSISELHEIACELRQEARLMADTEQLEKMHTDWERRRAEEKTA